MKTNLKCCHAVTKVMYEKYRSNFKSLLILLFFMMCFIQVTNAQQAANPQTQVANSQICNGMTIKDSTSGANGVVSFTSNLSSAGQAITWTIIQDNGSASFSENGQTTIQKTSVAGSNTISVNVGPNPGNFTVKLTFDGAQPPNSGSCSSSYSF